MSRTYGRLEFCPDMALWKIHAEPHIALRVKRVFERIHKGEHGQITLTDSDEVRRDLLWFMSRYELDCSAGDLKTLRTGARRHKDSILRFESIVDAGYEPKAFPLALPPREYQRRGAELALAKRSLLVGDQVGIGKTALAICTFTDPRFLPMAVVCPAGRLPSQWKAEIERFIPGLNVHVIKSTKLYELPREDGRGPDVVVLNYHKLWAWAQVLGSYCKGVVFDEAQELRRRESVKWESAKHLAESVGLRVALSATPVYNYGSEIWNVLQIVSPGCLGTYDEFVREWCDRSYTKHIVKDPRALGTYLREQFLMIRRTRQDVGRELPALSKITQEIDSDREVFDGIEDQATELAKIILSNETVKPEVMMTASRDLSNVIRQATGIAKAPYVAAFVRMLVEAGEKVVVFAWHRPVYDILLKSLEDLCPSMFTGSETPTKKDSEFQRFTGDGTDVMLMSLRAAAGVDGLQKVCKTAVVAELDWSPGVLEQCLGRVHRDGQEHPVVAYYLLSEDGSDPSMAEVLGLKRDQSEGIRDPHGSLIEDLVVDQDRIKTLAREYLSRRRGRRSTLATS